MKKALFWVLVILALAIAYYFLIYKKSKGIVSSPSQNITPPYTGPGTLGAPIPETAQVNPIFVEPTYVKVSYSDVTEAPAPTSDLILSAVTDSPGRPNSGPAGIYYVTGFQSKCKEYVWYNGLYYSLSKSKIDDQGYKNCFYKLASSSLPTQILLETEDTTTCAFKKYLAGNEYTFKEATTITSGIFNQTHKDYCVYTKQ